MLTEDAARVAYPCNSSEDAAGVACLFRLVAIKNVSAYDKTGASSHRVSFWIMGLI